VIHVFSEENTMGHVAYPYGMTSIYKGLEQSGEAIIIDRKVSAVEELGGILWAMNKMERTPPVLFKHVNDYAFPVAGNLFAERSRVCDILKLPQDQRELKEFFIEAMANPIAPRLVQSAPCQEEVVSEQIDLLQLLPFIKAGLDDGGRYLQPAFVSKDPETGVRNLGVYRVMALAGNRCIVNIRRESGIGMQFERAERKNQPFPVAIVIGAHPDIYAAGCTKMPVGMDELGLAGAIRRQPVDIVKCKTVDLEVPACASIVIEGYVNPPYEQAPEGPWPEYLRYLSIPATKPILDVTAVTYRRDAVHYCCLAGTKENYFLRITNDSLFYKYMKDRVGDFLDDACLTAGSAYWHHAVLKVRKTDYEKEGMQYNAALAAYGFSIHIDLVILVDDDIDIYNLEDIDWAITTRCNAKDQVHILPEGKSHRNVPIVGVHDQVGATDRRLRRAKWIIDATVPFHLKEATQKGIKLFSPARFQEVDLHDYFSQDDQQRWLG
jgi:2,5-furandicarboxylate decarboxylase 1